MAVLRGYKSGDEGQIVKLFNEVFKNDRDVSYWRWEFLEGNYGQAVMALADEDGRIVGQCTLLPSKLQVGEKDLFGGQSIDTMVHKDFRRRGYFENLAFLSYDMGRDIGIKFRYGFPSKEALQGILEKLGGSLVCDIPLYMYVYRVDRFLSILFKNKIISKIFSYPIEFVLWIMKKNKIKSKGDYEFAEINEFDQRFDELWERVRKNYPTMTLRQSDFLNWRIKNHPTIKYKTFGILEKEKLKGYIVLKDEDRLVKGKYPLKLGSIVDLIAEDEDSVVALCEKANKYFKSIGVDFAVCWILDGMKYGDTLKNVGFIKTKSRIPFAVKNLTEDSSIDDHIFKEENWYLMPIESDIY